MARDVAHILDIYILRAISGSRHATSLCSGVGIREYDTANVICHEHMHEKKKHTHTHCFPICQNCSQDRTISLSLRWPHHQLHARARSSACLHHLAVTTESERWNGRVEENTTSIDLAALAWRHHMYPAGQRAPQNTTSHRGSWRPRRLTVTMWRRRQMTLVDDSFAASETYYISVLETSAAALAGSVPDCKR